MILTLNPGVFQHFLEISKLILEKHLLEMEFHTGLIFTIVIKCASVRVEDGSNEDAS